MWLDKLPSRSRTAILWAVGFFLIAQLTLMVTIERWRPDWSDPEYGTRFRHLKRRIQREPGRPLLLVLGSSRVGNGLVADCLPPDSSQGPARPLVFNMSLAGGTPLCELLLLKRVLAARIHPRWVVIEVLPPSLNSEDKILASPDPVTPSRIRWSDLDVLDRHAPKSSWHRYRKWLATCLVPCFSNRYCLLSRYAASWLEPAKTTQVIFWRTCLTPCGWLPYPVKVVTPELRKRWLQRTRDEYTDTLVNFRVAPEADRLFREMLHTCRHEGIQVIGLLRMPEGTDFKKLYSPEATQCIDSYLRDLCRQEETQFIDASNWLEDDCFADGHHLLPPGAKRFTLRLWQEVLEPAVEGQMSPYDVGRAQE